MNRILIGLILLIFFSCNTETDITSGLVAHYTFDGDIKNPNQLIKSDGVVFSSDRFGNEDRACSFNGINSYILIEVSNMPAIESDKTISWWYFADSKPPYNEENSAENMIVLVDTISTLGIQFGFRSVWYKTKGFDSWEWGGGTLLEMNYPEFGKWHHCVYTYNSGIHNFFIDEELITSSSVKPKNGIPNQLMFGNYPGGNQYYKGKIDEVRIYKRVLNNSEITYLYNKRS